MRGGKKKGKILAPKPRMEAGQPTRGWGDPEGEDLSAFPRKCD